MVDGQSLTGGSGLINVPSGLTKRAFAVQSAPLAGDQLTTSFLRHATRAKRPVGSFGWIGVARPRLDVGDSSY